MTARRALIVCPGRGSYDRTQLGQLQDRSEAASQVVQACDGWRRDHGRPPVSELDRADGYRAALHVAGEHASLLTFACSLADLADLDRSRFEVVGVTGNSMGWYTALAASGALSLEQAIRLVDTMGAYQQGNVVGGQVLTPMSAPDWSHDLDAERRIDEALATARAEGHQAWWSIRLGGHAVLGADPGGLKSLLANLPKVSVGSRTFPLQLPMHSAFHTPLMQPTSDRAFAELGNLPLTAPAVALVDGRGAVSRPHWASPTALLDYTLGHQVVAPYDFTTAVRAALRHTGADVVIALGPGNSLGGPLARVLVQEGWAGCRDREAFDARQESDEPLLLSFGVRPQRQRLVR